MRGIRVAIVGATGLVGQKILQVLQERQLPVVSLVPLATEGLGRNVVWDGHSVAVEALSTMDWNRVDVAFFAASGEVSAQHAPVASGYGVTVVDKSSYFRMNPEIPLIVPEVNADAIRDSHLIASPNCSTIQMVVALDPIRRHYGIRRILVATYQAVSGTGRDAMTVLENQTRNHRHPKPVAAVYPEPIGFNVLPYCDQFGDLDYTGEEWKLTRETQKIFGSPIPVTATAVRVPVFIGHSEAVYVETESPLGSIDEIRALLRRSPGIRVVDDPTRGLVPTPLQAQDQDEVLVGRIRRDPFDPQGLHLFVVGDNLRKGAATNAVQIIETLSGRFS